MKRSGLFVLFVLFVFLVIIVVGCKKTSNDLDLQPPSGRGTVHGVLISQVDGTPYQNAIVSLAEVSYNDLGEGAYFLNTATAPTTTSDMEGRFIFTDVPPADYVIIVGDPMIKYVALSEESGQVKILKVIIDQILDTGTLEIDL